MRLGKIGRYGVEGVLRHAVSLLWQTTINYGPQLTIIKFNAEADRVHLEMGRVCDGYRYGTTVQLCWPCGVAKLNRFKAVRNSPMMNLKLFKNNTRYTLTVGHTEHIAVDVGRVQKCSCLGLGRSHWICATPSQVNYARRPPTF